MKHSPNLRHALVIGHADADGHLAVAQSIKNLISDGHSINRVIVDRKLTASWRFWNTTFSRLNLENADFILCVDIMLNPSDPKDSLRVIVDQALRSPEKRFEIIDHHKMDLGNEQLPSNLTIRFVTRVADCCYGPPSDLMLVAAICDNDELPVEHLLQPAHYLRATGMQRAVTASAVAGLPLIMLLLEDRWDVIELIAKEDRSLHKTMYGNRLKNLEASLALKLAERTCRLDFDHERYKMNINTKTQLIRAKLMEALSNEDGIGRPANSSEDEIGEYADLESDITDPQEISRWLD